MLWSNPNLYSGDESKKQKLKHLRSEDIRVIEVCKFKVWGGKWGRGGGCGCGSCQFTNEWYIYTEPVEMEGKTEGKGPDNKARQPTWTKWRHIWSNQNWLKERKKSIIKKQSKKEEKTHLNRKYKSTNCAQIPSINHVRLMKKEVQVSPTTTRNPQPFPHINWALPLYCMQASFQCYSTISMHYIICVYMYVIIHALYCA